MPFDSVIPMQHAEDMHPVRDLELKHCHFLNYFLYPLPIVVWAVEVRVVSPDL